MTVEDMAREMKLSAPRMGATSETSRNQALQAIRNALEAHKDDIFAENHKDLDEADKTGVADAVKKRLKFDEGKLGSVLEGLTMLMELEDPIGKVTLNRELDEGLRLVRQSCPIGVIGVIFEARPDALVQIASLCIKSGNCAILKGGKETLNTNRILFNVIKEAVTKAGLPEGCLAQAESHAEIDELLKLDRYVDLLIPRGSNKFVRYIMDNTSIPVMGHSDGICHIYVDEETDEAIDIIVDAKIQYAAACNAVETLLINKNVSDEFLKNLAKRLKSEGVKINATPELISKLGAEAEEVTQISDNDFDTEYLSFALGIKFVSDIDEAIDHINQHGSHHTDSILTKNQENIEKFMQLVDSAGVYANCSTRFSDGFRYGFGAEVGISTGKIHARGPVGLDGLMTYKYKLYGSGQTVDEYATGKKSFTHKDI
ncbi:MAG: glutamate-5-semialdehyde dehydrogenase [Eubacterium sp.]|nr:glutamate-5-semialdehyde dehydrogenase [Eubacterium sp.]